MLWHTVSVCVCVCVCVSVCLCVCASVCVYIYIYIHTYTHIHTQTYPIDRVNKKKLKQLSSRPYLRLVAAIYQRYFKCTSAMIKLLTIRTLKHSLGGLGGSPAMQGQGEV